MNKEAVRKNVKSDEVSVEQTEIRMAPIPSPEDLRKYKDIDPEFPGKIFTMAEQEQMARNKREDKKVELMREANKREFRLKFVSLVVSLIIISGFLALAYRCLELGFSIISLGFIGIPLVGIVGYLTFQKRNLNRNH